jgi:hypothetical protein
MVFHNRPELRSLARLASVAFAAAALFFAVMKYSNAGAATLALEGERGANMVEVCSGDCTILTVVPVVPAAARGASVTPPLFQLRAGDNWSRLATPTLPLDITCAKSCAEFGGDPKPGAPKTLYAEKTVGPYHLTFKNGQQRPLEMSIPTRQSAQAPQCYMPTSKSGMPVACGTSTTSNEE